jgi:plastocyanin
MKRTQYNNNYNSGSNQYMSGNQDTNQNGNGNQDSNQYGNGQYNAYHQQQNQDSNQNGNGHQMVTTTTPEHAMETTTRMMDHVSMMREETTTTAMAHETTIVNMEESMMMEESSVMMQQETTSTQMAYAEETSSVAYSMPTYGSGSSGWNNGYNNCVSRTSRLHPISKSILTLFSECMAQFGSPPSTMTMESQDSLPSATGTGAVHTVLVAPTGAGLRYMPFAINATVGDTVRYVWTGPNNHTATLSSALAICNKSGIAEQRNFVSGVKNASQGMQIFDVTVETADPQFFYCSVAQHCQKGMFGIINPASNVGGPNTVGTMMNSWLQSSPSLQAAYNYAMQNISQSSAMNWGMGMSLDGIPESAYADVAANVLFTQANFAANPGMLETGNGAATPDGSPVRIVADMNVLLSNTDGAIPTTLAQGATPSTAPAVATGSLPPVNAQYNAASRSGAGVWVAAVIGVAGWLLI